MSVRGIILPVGTVVYGSASATPVVVYEQQVGTMFVDSSNNANIVSTVSNTSHVVPAPSAPIAYGMISQVANFLNSTQGGLYLVIPPPSFTRVKPTSYPTGSLLQIILFGNSFISNGINALKLDDGAGHVFPLTIEPGASDQYLPTYPTTVTTAAAYTIYYSTDGGNTWITTGLTFTST